MCSESNSQLPPHWSIAKNRLTRTYRTANWKSTIMVVNAIGHLAEVAWHHPELAISYNKVVVTLTTHSAGAITDKDYALAQKIESYVHWQPANEESALSGTPDDARFAYVRYD